MSKKTHKTLIGAFVVGAIALVVIGVLFFGSGKFLRNRQKYVIFFDGSVKGLQVGAPVAFRGVKIGDVTDIIIRSELDNVKVVIPVYVDIDLDKFITGANQRLSPYKYFNSLIKKGLKARLEMQSFVTGQLMIGMDFYPDKPTILLGFDKKYPEIPTVPTSMEELAKTIQDLPLKEITERLNSVLEGVDTLVHTPEIRESFISLNRSLTGFDKLTKNIDAQIGPLISSLSSTSVAARSAFTQAEKTLRMDEGVPGDIAVGIRDTLTAARSTLDETQKAVEGVKQIAGQNANLGYEINRSLEEMIALSRTLRSLADYLDRHPEALIKGKNPSKGE